MVLKIIVGLLFVAIFAAETEGKTCYQRYSNGTRTEFTCPGDCCGLSVFRYCCPVLNSTTCTKKLPDGTDTTITCSNDCCGTETTRYCCIKVFTVHSGSEEVRNVVYVILNNNKDVSQENVFAAFNAGIPLLSVTMKNGGGTTAAIPGKTCTKKHSYFDEETTTISCPEECCGTVLTRYCCTEKQNTDSTFSDIKDAINTGLRLAGSLSTTWIIIISVICVVVVAIIVGVIVCCCCCCRKAASSGGKPGVVVSGQGRANAGYAANHPVGYSVTSSQPAVNQSYGDPRKTQYPGGGGFVDPSGSKERVIQGPPPVDTKAVRM